MAGVATTVDDVPPHRAAFWPAAWRAIKRFQSQHMTDHAAALTYYAMMSLFPGVLLGITLLGLLGASDLPQRAADYVARRGADPSTADVIRATMKTMTDSSGGALGAALIVSILLGLNGASGAFGAAGRALNVVWDVDEQRSFVRRKLNDVAATVAVILLFLLVIVAIFLGGGIADDIFGAVGLGGSARDVWAYARWPVALIAAVLGYAMVYGFAPDISPRHVRWVSPGAFIGVGLWIVASIGFAIYVRNFSHYGAAYGVAGAFIILLLWLWISSCALLLGAELNAELDRTESAGRAAPPPPSAPPSAGEPAGQPVSRSAT